MKYLTPQNVIQIHFELVEATGGSQGLRDLGLLESAVMRPQQTFGGKDLYPTLILKAAALVHSLLLNHVFVDGNKRTAMISMIEFLTINNKHFKASNREIVDYSLFIENKKPSIEQIADWIKEHLSN